MLYGKIINNNLYYAPSIISVNGERVENPTEELLLSLGYMPVVFTEILDPKEGYHIYSEWVVQNDTITQQWFYEKDAESTLDIILDERLHMIEEQIRQLTFSLNQISESIIEINKKEDTDMPYGDYVNPLGFYPGIFVKVGLFYTDGDNIWEAIKDGTPASFADREYFDIID